MALRGQVASKEAWLIKIELISCETSDLADGQRCMNETEVKDYFAPKKVRILQLFNFIDYEDIEEPLKTYQVAKGGSITI